MLVPRSQSQSRKQSHSSLSRARTARFHVERLEDRTAPAVTAIQNGAGVVTVTLGNAGDTARIRGAAASGDAINVIEVVGNVETTTTSFTGVTGIAVVDGGANAGQTATFDDAGAGTRISIPGAITATGIESVDVATANGTLQAASLGIVAASAQIRLDANATTTGAAGQSYDGPVFLGSAIVTLDAGAAGGVSFLQTVNSTAGGGKALVVNAGGATSFTGIVGGSLALASLTTDAAGTLRLGADITTIGAQRYNDPVIVAGLAVTVSSNAAGDIRFANTIDAQASGTNSLTVNTAGPTGFGGTVGATALGGLFTDSPGTTTIGASVTTVGAQTYNDPTKVSGAAVALTSTAGGNIAFNGTLDDDVAGATALTVNTTTGATVFSGTVGGAIALGSLTTDAGTGNTVFGPGTIGAVVTQNGQTYNDPVRLNAASVTFSSTQNGNLTFANTLNGTSTGATDASFNTGGLTTFTGRVGGTAPLATIATNNAGQPNEATVIQNLVTTTGAQTYSDAATIAPTAGLTSLTVNSTTAGVAFAKALGGTSAVPVTVQAATNLTLGGNATFSASGSHFNARAGASGAGAFAIAAGLAVRADIQTWQAGDGPAGSGTAAVADLATNAPSFRDAAGANAPQTFVLRQDGAITDASLPTVAQFGTAPPQNYTILSDDGALTLATATALAGSGTANLTLASDRALTLGATIDAPLAVVRLRSASADVTQTAGSITAAALGVRGGTGVAITGANAIAGTLAALATAGNVQIANGSPATVGALGVDPLAIAFTATTGVAATAGTVTFSQPGNAPLNLTVAAPVSGSTVTAVGGSANDAVTVNYTLGATLANGLVFTGNGGSDALTLSDAGGAAAHTFAVNNGVTRDSNVPITYSGVETVSVLGGNAADTFTVTPDATAAIAATGGLPTGTAGDKITVDLTGTTSPNLSLTAAADGFQGSAAFGNRATVTFSQMEVVSPRADIQVAATAAPAFIPIGGSTTVTVVVTNAGPDAVTGASITEAFPAGVTATWTATASTGSSVAAASGTGDINTTAALIANGTVTFTITLTAVAGFQGSASTTAAATAPAFDSNAANNQATATFTVQPVALTAVGAGAGGGPQVKVYNADGTQRFSFFAYDVAYAGGVTVATGDVTGDGVEDIVTGSAQSSSHVKVFDGQTGSLVASFFAFPGFNGGVNVAVANGRVVVGAGVGGGPIVAGFNVNGGASPAFSFFAFDSAFRGGVQVGGSAGFLVVGAGPGGGPHVKVFDAASLGLVASFFAFPVGNPDGVSVGMGIANGQPTVFVGAGVGSVPTVATFDPLTGTAKGSFLAFEQSFRGGVRVAGTTANGQPASVVGAGPGGAPRVRILGPTGAAAFDFFAFDPSFRGGVFVG